jgi:hypothetical protein
MRKQEASDEPPDFLRERGAAAVPSAVRRLPSRPYEELP